MNKKFTHVDENDNAVMVDVSNKSITERTAIAEGTIIMSEECFLMIEEGKHKKGDVLGVAQIAGIMASKKTSSLIPLCHNLNLTNVRIEFNQLKKENCFGYKATSYVKCNGVTGVEMEALVAVSTSLLTIYDMCKAVDKRMIINDIHLVKKSGGKSGEFLF